MPDVINFGDAFKFWSRFSIGFDFLSVFNTMTTYDFYQWKHRLGKRITYALDHGKWTTAKGYRIGGYISDAQNTNLWVGFFWRGERVEPIFDMYWNCLWGITQQIIIPTIIQMGHKQADIKITLTYQDNYGREEHRDIYL